MERFANDIGFPGVDVKEGLCPHCERSVKMYAVGNRSKGPRQAKLMQHNDLSNKVCPGSNMPVESDDPVRGPLVQHNVLEEGDDERDCSQCGHPFGPHVLVAFDGDNVFGGGTMHCPVKDCRCFSTWGVKIK